MRRAARWCAATLMAMVAPACADAQRVTADDAWIATAPPGAQVMAGYLTLRNNGDQTLHCDRVSGADFGAAEIHRTAIEDGRSRMLREQVIEVPAGGHAQLAPGGLHLMLFRPLRDLAAGEITRLTLECGNLSTTIDFVVRARS